jgi:glycosyltransferase A (GT-A) superfamily protein (DUF2064 family)
MILSGTTASLHVTVMAKAPVAGRVKTRLCPPLTPAEAAEVAEAALADTLEAVAACGAPRKVLALDGEPGPWLPPGFTVVPQTGATFNQRLANAWAHIGGPGVQIGMDTPQVTTAELDSLLTRLDEPPPSDAAPTDTPSTDGPAAILGYAVDGGWWVIGWRRADPRSVFAGIPMSAPSTGLAQELRLRALGFRLIRAEPRLDIDAIDDLAAVAAAHPHLRTAELTNRLLVPSGVTA